MDREDQDLATTAMDPEQFDQLMSSLDTADDAPRLADAARRLP
ncbi:hypothetical protein [Mycolicibacterium peregrinum]|nr:hypothetical protein [Mycolicibacterium peregrinum]